MLCFEAVDFACVMIGSTGKSIVTANPLSPIVELISPGCWGEGTEYTSAGFIKPIFAREFT